MSYFENFGSQFDQFISSIKGGKKIYILPPISFLLSFLFIFTGFSNLFMSVIYMINIAFFAFIVRDSYSVRKENILPLLIICLSIILSSIQMITTIDALASLGAGAGVTARADRSSSTGTSGCFGFVGADVVA